MDLCSKEGSMNWAQNMIVPNKTTSSSDQLVKQEQSSSSSSQLKCPRCNSSNTKFCYYNNYNRSQPRHFCKSCKRHWTLGGTLRNVPVGGGRKNKRLKITTTTTTTTTEKATSNNNNSSSNSSSSSSSSNSSEEQQPWLRQGGYKDSFFGPDFATYGLKDEENLVGFDPSLLSNLPSFFGNISSSFSGQFKFPSVSDSSYSTITTAAAIDDDPSMKLPETSGSMDSLSYWNWDCLDSLISTDLKLPAWDDLQTQEPGL